MSWLYENWSGELYDPDGKIFTSSLDSGLAVNGSLDLAVLPGWVREIIGDQEVTVNMAGTQ